MDIQSALAAPMALIRQAVQADTNLDFMRAIDYYEEGMESLRSILDSPAAKSNPKLRAVLESRIHEYTERVEYLLQQLDKTLNPPSEVPEAPFFDPSSSNEDESALQRKDYEDHHPHRVSQMAPPNLPDFEAVTKSSSSQTRLGSSPTGSHGVKHDGNDSNQDDPNEDGEEWVYIPEVIPDAPNFASVGFSKFHNSFGPAPGSAPSEEDDVFKLSQHVGSRNQQPTSISALQGSQSSPQSGFSSSSVPSAPNFQQPTQQMINGKLYTYGPNQLSPYGSGSAAMAQMKNDLQLALDTAEQAKEEDKKKNYPKAFLLYRRALDYFVKVLNAELNQYTRQSLNKTVKVYVIRAEKLKEYLEKLGELPEDDGDILEPAVVPPVPFNPSVSSLSSTSSAPPEPRADLDIRVGPTVKEAQTSFWNDSAPLYLRVDMRKNLVTPGDTFQLNVMCQNRSSVKVSELRVGIIQTETLTTIDIKAQRKVDSKSRVYNLRAFRPDGAFPLKSSMWQGMLEYWVPGDILFTDADFSTSFSREHKLAITCIIPRHNDLTIEFPIRVVPFLAADGSANPNLLRESAVKN